MYINIVSRDGKTALYECKTFGTIPYPDSLTVTVDGDSYSLTKGESVYVMNERGDTIKKVTVPGAGSTNESKQATTSSKSKWETGNAKRSHRRHSNS